MKKILDRVREVKIFGFENIDNLFAIEWALEKRRLTSDIKKGVKNFAAVRLVINNSDKVLPPILDTAEITIERRFLVAQESEYFINGIACRLKDIKILTKVLLMDDQTDLE